MALTFMGVSNILNAQQLKDSIREKQIQEVVVTALGIKRDQKGLGYAAEKKDSATFEKRNIITGQPLWKVRLRA